MIKEWLRDHIDAIDEATRLVQAAPAMRDALVYYRNQYTGCEPSLSVFNRMVDEALSKANGEERREA
jgi:hypothetical protein